MARSRLKLAWMQKRSARKSSFKRRSACLVSKVEELSILCGLSALLIICNQEFNLVTIWPNLNDAEDLLSKFMSLPDYIRSRKMKDLKSFLEDRMTSMRKEYLKAHREINEMEMNDSIDQIARRGKLFNEFSIGKLTDLNSFLKERMDKIRALIAYRTGNHKRSPSLVASDQHRNSSDHIIGQTEKHSNASLFGSVKKQKGSSMQPNSSGYDNVTSNNMELPLTSNDDPFRARSLELPLFEVQPAGRSRSEKVDSAGMRLDMSFNAGNEEGSSSGLVRGAKNVELPFDFTEFLRSRSSSPSHE